MTHLLERQSKNLRAGFTLMEMLITIAILGILMAIGIPAFRGVQRANAIKVTKQQIGLLEKQIGFFEMELDKYPERLEDLVKRPVAGDYYDQEMVADWAGPYFEKAKLPKDAWKRKFIYKPTLDGPRPYELYSYGPKGKKAPRAEWIRAK